MPLPEQPLIDQAQDYIEGGSFRALYDLAGRLLPRLVHEQSHAVTLAGLVLAASVEYPDPANRRMAISQALLDGRHVVVRSSPRNGGQRLAVVSATGVFAAEQRMVDSTPPS